MNRCFISLGISFFFLEKKVIFGNLWLKASFSVWKWKKKIISQITSLLISQTKAIKTKISLLVPEIFLIPTNWDRHALSPKIPNSSPKTLSIVHRRSLSYAPIKQSWPFVRDRTAVVSQIWYNSHWPSTCTATSNRCAVDGRHQTFPEASANTCFESDVLPRDASRDSRPSYKYIGVSTEFSLRF